MNKWTFGFVHFTVLCFSLSAKLCSHPADRLAGEMYLLTFIHGLAKLQRKVL